MPWKPLRLFGAEAHILHGTLSQSRVPSSKAGTQCTACAITFLAWAHAQPVSKWDSSTMDAILTEGTELHERCPSTDRRGFADIDSFVGEQQIMQKSITVSISETEVRNGLAPTAKLAGVDGADQASDVISEFLMDNKSLLLVLNGFTVSLFVQNDFLFLFNSHDCDNLGSPTGSGRACVIKFKKADANVVEKVVSRHYVPKDLALHNKHNCFYMISAISVVVHRKKDVKQAKKRRISDGMSHFIPLTC